MLCIEKMFMPLTVLRVQEHCALWPFGYMTDEKIKGLFVRKRDYIIGQEVKFAFAKPYSHGRTHSKQPAIILTTKMPPVAN